MIRDEVVFASQFALPALNVSLVTAAGVGLLSGTHTAIWGMYKDAVHEGFTLGRFARSLLVGALVAIVIQGLLGLPLTSARGLVLLFGLAYATERVIVEVWKTFVREEDQTKYFIPMQFSVRGVPVTSRLTRLLCGAGYVSAIAICVYGISRLDLASVSSSPTGRAAIVGLAFGIVVAIGGAWKDAPTEGFELLKFFRSPVVTVCYAVLLSRLTESPAELGVAAIGYERATVETYKKFFFPRKPPGKFSGKPVLYPEMLRRRIYFVPAYVAISLAAIGALTIAASS